ncbi:MAG TPA: hypothetical protein VII34_12090 [Pyrinomonadaceae bacterium]
MKISLTAHPVQYTAPASSCLASAHDLSLRQSHFTGRQTRFSSPARSFTGADNRFIRTNIPLSRTGIGRNLSNIAAITPNFSASGIDNMPNLAGPALSLTGTELRRTGFRCQRRNFTDPLPDHTPLTLQK